MKKFYAALFLIVFGSGCLNSNAQTISIKAGLIFSNLHIEDDGPDSEFDSKIKIGYQLGAMVAFPISEKFAFETGILFSTKGNRIKQDIPSGFGPDFEFKSILELVYVEVPLHLERKFTIGKLEMFGAFGPYVAYGLYGRTKSEIVVFGEAEKVIDDVKWGNDEMTGELRRLDYGLTAGAGVHLKSFRVAITYSYGLANISSYTDNNSKIQNRVVGLAVSYRFGKKTKE